MTGLEPEKCTLSHRAAGPKPRLQGITPRALVIGILLVPVMCFWNEYTEIISQSTDLAAMSLPIAVLFALVVLIALNLALMRWLPRLAFSQAELLYIFIMQTVSIGISGIGMMQFLCTAVADIFYFATPENRWAEKIHPFLTRWLFPDPKILKGFFVGKSSLYEGAVLRGWVMPVMVWSAFIFVLLGVMLCLNVILRRQWMDRERLNFPITAIPLELTREGGAAALLRSKSMWAGFWIAAALEILAGLNYLYPSVPFIPIKPNDPRLDLTPYFTTAPWSSIGYTVLAFYPLVIGLTYFLTLEVGFSLWFFYLFTKVQSVACAVLGFGDPGSSLAVARMPYVGEQSAGAFIGLAGFAIWGMRRHLRDVWRKAVTGTPEVRDENEPIPYRWAVAGAAGGMAALVAFGWAAGAGWLAPVILFALYFLFILSFTRIRAEAGLAWGFGPDMNPHQVMVSASDTRSFGTRALTGLATLMWFDLDYRCVAMPHQLEAMKLGESARMNNRHIALVILLVTVVAAFSSWWAVLHIYYRYGAAAAHTNEWRTYMGKVPWMNLQDWLNNPQRLDLPRMEAVGGGVAVTILLMTARSRFVWWPFHPVGYAVAGTFTMPWLWFPTLLGWLMKLLALRYGGMTAYRRGIPFFVGLILGDYVVGSLWAVFGMVTGIRTYKCFPI